MLDGPAPGLEAVVALAPLRPESTLGHLLRRAQQAHTVLWNAEFGGELTGPQYAVLSVLSRRPGTDQTSVATLASLDTSSAADIVSRLHRNGWSARDRNDTDARRNQLTLTPAARAALRDITPRATAVQERLLSPIPAVQCQEFLRTLAIVAFAGSPTLTDLPPDSHVPTLALSSAPGHLIRRAEQLHRQHWTRRVGRTFTPTQYGLLSCLNWHPGVDQSTAGELASLDKSSVVDITSRLRQRGFVGIHRDETDRRRRWPQLTPLAVAALAEVTPAVAQVQRDLLEPLDPLCVEDLVAGLHRIAYGQVRRDPSHSA